MPKTMPITSAFLMLAIISARAADPEDTRVLQPGQKLQDRRLNKPKTLNDYFPWTPPTSLENWHARRSQVREQVLVATGLWPMPEKTPLNPVIHGKIDRDDYTVEKVFFASYPGHYVSGNLYRPKQPSGKRPGVLCPHGHWPDGRFYDALKSGGEKAVQNQIQIGAEKTAEGARFPLQARCAQLARMGCVVFHYDMVGYADSQQIKHREGFRDVQAELNLQSFMSLQTFNSVRALDFLMSLPEVDPKRIGVTGASGGGTQTFILGAIDDRPASAFPAVMVSTAMQGGCVCENCSYLRQETGNIELAALFAPRPLGMSGAHDWTQEIETKGYPQLKALYRLYGVEELVLARAFPQFEHNYNQVSREVMYNWFNKHLHLEQPEPVVEKPFVPIPPEQLRVYDAEHPVPMDSVEVRTLRQTMRQAAEKAMAQKGAEEQRRILATALRVMVSDTMPRPEDIDVQEVGDKVERDGLRWRRYLLGRKGKGEQIPALAIIGRDFGGTVVLWIHPQGKASLYHDGKLCPAAQRILDGKAAILAPDVFMTGEYGDSAVATVDAQYAGFTFGYNRPLLANRVHDILTALAFARKHELTKEVRLAGFDKAGIWALLAAAIAGNEVHRVATDLNHFRFERVAKMTDEMMLPGAVKYGDVPAYVSLCLGGVLLTHNAGDTGLSLSTLKEKHGAGIEQHITVRNEKSSDEDVAAWLIR